MWAERGSATRYAVAIAAVAVAVVLESWRSAPGDARRFVLLNGAVLVTAWYGGRGPALLAIALATAAADYFLLQPRTSFRLAAEEATALGMCVAEMGVTAVLVVAIMESRASGQRREAQLRKLNKAHRALGVANEALVRAKDDTMLLEDICRAIVEVAGYRMCWVGRAERDAAKTVRPIARAGYDDGFLDRVEVTWSDTEHGRGAVGTAIRTERSFVLRDIATDPAFAPWRAEALRRGYGSVIAVPLCADGQVMGALAIYASERDAFDADAVKLLTDLGSDLAYGLAALRARASAAAERACFEAAVMQAPVAIALYTGPDDVVRVANRRWFGLGIPIDAVGRPRRESLPETSRERVLPVLAEVHETGEPREMNEVTISRKRGDGAVRDRFYNVAYQPLSAPNGVVTDIIAAIADVTDLVRARRAGEEARVAAELASRSKDELLRTVSHELRTPLTPILGFAEALQRRQEVRPDELHRALDVILRNAREEARLVDELIDVSEIAAGSMRMEMRPVELGPIVRACVDDARPAAVTKGVALDAAVAPDTLLGGDAGRLAQVVRTLLSNAIKFTPRGGHVSVEVTRKGDSLRLKVTDSGKGIAPSELPHVFELMRTGDGSLRRAHGGLGLGLYLVRHVVEAHGGRVSAESAGEGRGATLVAELHAPVQRGVSPVSMT